MQAMTLVWPVPIAVMIASTAVWAARGVDGRNVGAAQMDLLRAEAATQSGVALELEHLRPIQRAALPQRMRLQFERLPNEAGRNASLFDLPRMPPGEYRLTPVADVPRGWLMIGVGRDQFSIRSGPLTNPLQPFHIRLPVPVRGIAVRGDEDARQAVHGLVVEPLSVLPPDRFDTEYARTAVRYGQATVFFLDDRSFPEPDAFWVGGSRTSSFAVESDDTRPVASLLLRNGPQPNQVTVESSGVRSDLTFAPGEERRVTAALDASRHAAIVTMRVAGGFRPSEQDSASRDNRFLGIWVKIE